MTIYENEMNQVYTARKRIQKRKEEIKMLKHMIKIKERYIKHLIKFIETKAKSISNLSIEEGGN